MLGMDSTSLVDCPCTINPRDDSRDGENMDGSNLSTLAPRNTRKSYKLVGSRLSVSRRSSPSFQCSLNNIASLHGRVFGDPSLNTHSTGHLHASNRLPTHNQAPKTPKTPRTPKTWPESQWNRPTWIDPSSQLCPIGSNLSAIRHLSLLFPPSSPPLS